MPSGFIEGVLVGLAGWAAAMAVSGPRRPARVSGRAPRSVAWGELASGNMVRRMLRPRPAGRGSFSLPEAVETMAAAVGMGRSLLDGVVSAAEATAPPLRAELMVVADRVRRGMALTDALDRWAADTSLPGVALVAAAASLAADAGGDIDTAFAGVAATLREHRAVAREVRALSAQARLSATVIGVAPLGFGVVAVASDRAIARFLLGSPGGLACLGAGLGLDLAGWRWMRRIVESVR